MAKSKATPLKDEQLCSVDDIYKKVDKVETVVTKQNEYLQHIAKNGGFDSEFNFICNEFNVRQTIENALDEYLQKKNLQIEKTDKDNLLSEAKQVLQKYIEALKTATEAHERYAEKMNMLAKDETPRDECVQSSVTVQHPQLPLSTKGMLAYLFYRLPWYYIRCLLMSSYFRRWIIIIMICMWVVSICLTCIMAVDNARMHQVYHAILMHTGT